ncbi:MAG: helix-turn-helix transcriptional regulator [Bacillus sp. (in: Bacteria)]|nr:helix-turn-helix transcriptional regulator [Bacillus sp. (in: firmicutes)]MCM1427329.1 helix-turn-helix transcriptional regulator [Eubacterium sp.]
MEIGERIKSARNLRGFTLEDVAKKVGVTKSTVQRYENGKINSIKIPVVESIALALNVNPAWIAGKSDVMELPTQKIPKIMQYYNQLNDIGKHEAEKRVEELTSLPQYTHDIKAAHNDYEAEPGEPERMREDISKLKKPD